MAEHRIRGIAAIEALVREVDQLVARTVAEAGGAWTPPVDVVECRDAYHVLVDLPGVAPESLAVTLRDRQLEVTGWKGPLPEQVGNRRFLCVERASGRFAVSVELPGPVDPSRSTARLASGVLRVSLCRIEDRRHRVHTLPVSTEEP